MYIKKTIKSMPNIRLTLKGRGPKSLDSKVTVILGMRVRMLNSKKYLKMILTLCNSSMMHKMHQITALLK